MEMDGKKVIKDLAFHKAKSQKEYADLILKAVLTNRDKVVSEELIDEAVNQRDLNIIISSYSQSIGNKGWDFYDVHAENPNMDKSKGIDYNWLDKRGRIAVQINIMPNKGDKYYELKRIEFRSRLDILPSEAFPGGEISDYKKIVSKG